MSTPRAGRVEPLRVALIAGVVLLVPPQLHAGALARGHHPSYLEALGDFFDVHRSWELPIPVDGEIFEPAHLWFLAFLFVFTLMLLPLFHDIRRGGYGRVMGWVEARPLTCLLALGLVVVLAEAVLGIEDAGGWNRWAYPAFLMLGFLLVARPTVAERVASRRRALAVAGTLSFLVLAVIKRRRAVLGLGARGGPAGLRGPPDRRRGAGRVGALAVGGRQRPVDRVERAHGHLLARALRAAAPLPSHAGAVGMRRRQLTRNAPAS